MKAFSPVAERFKQRNTRNWDSSTHFVNEFEPDSVVDVRFTLSCFFSYVKKSGIWKFLAGEAWDICKTRIQTLSPLTQHFSSRSADLRRNLDVSQRVDAVRWNKLLLECLHFGGNVKTSEFEKGLQLLFLKKARYFQSIYIRTATFLDWKKLIRSKCRNRTSRLLFLCPFLLEYSRHWRMRTISQSEIEIEEVCKESWARAEKRPQLFFFLKLIISEDQNSFDFLL